MLYIICNLRNIQKTEMAEFRVIHQSWVEKSAAWFASHGFDVLPTRISLLPLFILTLRDLGLKKEGSLWSMKIDIASPHEQMSNSTVTISTTFFQSAAMYSWNNEDIHTHFTPLASKIQKKVWNILCSTLSFHLTLNLKTTWRQLLVHLVPILQFFVLLGTISSNDMLKSPLVI